MHIVTILFESLLRTNKYWSINITGSLSQLTYHQRYSLIMTRRFIRLNYIYMSYPGFSGVRVARLYTFICLCCPIVCLYVPSSVLWCPLRFPHKTIFGSSLSPVVCSRANVLLTLFVFVCVLWCPTHIVLCFCFVFPRLVYPMLQVSLDCQFLVAQSVFLSIFDWLLLRYSLTFI